MVPWLTVKRNHSEVFSAIQDAKQAGVKVVIATGRPYRRCCQTSGRLAVGETRVTLGDLCVPLSKKLLLAMEIISESDPMRIIWM